MKFSGLENTGLKQSQPALNKLPNSMSGSPLKSEHSKKPLESKGWDFLECPGFNCLPEMLLCRINPHLFTIKVPEHSVIFHVIEIYSGIVQDCISLRIRAYLDVRGRGLAQGQSYTMTSGLQKEF